MKLKEYIEKLKELEKDYGEMILIFSIDDEGNGYRKVIYEPCPMQMDNLAEYCLEKIESEDEDGHPIDIVPNCICIN